MPLFRLVTIHPALVHVTMGTLPVIVIAYVLAHRRRSERWTFVGDTTLVISAVATLLAVIFGVISFVRIHWVGSSGLWRWAHLVVGACAAAILSTFAVIRARRRARHPVTARGALFASLAVVATCGLAGWIGGEILVFRGGAGVIAAGDGVLAPASGPTRHSHDMIDLMDRIRERWAAITTDTAMMIAVAPRDRTFDDVATAAAQLAALGDELAAQSDAPPTRVFAARLGPHPKARDSDADATASDDLPRQFAEAARRLETAARAHDLATLSVELGQTTAACAQCHDEMR